MSQSDNTVYKQLENSVKVSLSGMCQNLACQCWHMACQNWHVSFSGMPKVALMPKLASNCWKTMQKPGCRRARNGIVPILARQIPIPASTFWHRMSASGMPDVTSGMPNAISGMPKVDIKPVYTPFLNGVNTCLESDLAYQCQLLACQMPNPGMPHVNLWHAKYWPKQFENSVKTCFYTVWGQIRHAKTSIWHPKTVWKQCKNRVPVSVSDTCQNLTLLMSESDIACQNLTLCAMWDSECHAGYRHELIAGDI